MLYSISEENEGYCEIITFKKENGQLKPVNKYIVGEVDLPFYNKRQRTLFNILTDCRFLNCQINKPYEILKEGALYISNMGVKVNKEVNILENFNQVKMDKRVYVK